MGESYVDYLRETGLKEYAGAEGFRGVLVLRRPVGRSAEFVLLTLWDDLDAVRSFAGPEPERAVYYPDDGAYFPEEERRPFVNHYEVLESPVPDAVVG
jgi:heme-degrading monooxygenase HmoA